MQNPNPGQQVAAAILDYMRQCGGTFSEWYCGIASAPRDRLFVDHCVNEQGCWIYRDCATDTIARSVEDYFHGLGCKGGPGGGDQSTRYVYAYRITTSTREDC